MKTKQLCMGVLAAGVLVLTSGCIVLGLAAAGATGAGVMAYNKGDFEATEPVPIEQAMTAVDKTITDMGMSVIKQDKDALTGYVRAKSSFGTVRYKLASKGPSLTKISIRVGTFGDEEYQAHIYSKLKANLESTQTASN